MLKSFELAKIIVCTYPETTFIEALGSGIPTILIFPKNHWAFHPKFENLVNILLENKIIFYNPENAAVHINNVWKNPSEWWKKQSIKKTLEYTFDMIGNPNNKNWINSWKEFLK